MIAPRLGGVLTRGYVDGDSEVSRIIMDVEF